MNSDTKPLTAISENVLPFTTSDDTELEDIWWTRWSLLAPYWQGYRRSMLQANFLKGHLMKRIRIKSNTTRSVPGNLERFLALPTELIFEVFKHLHALDLYHMSLACRTFKQALSEPISYPLWKAAFAAIPSFPACPSDLTEPQWAYLMFGSVECEDCGRCGAQPDVALYKNFCNGCTEKHFLSKKDILEMFSSHPDPKRVYSRLKTVCQSRCRLVTLQLRTRTHERGTEKRWMREHVEQYAPMVLKELELEREEEDIPVDVVDASDPRVWRIGRLEKIAATNEHTMITLRWVVGILQELQDEHRKRTRACLRRCRKRIANMNLGFSSSDITVAATYDWTPYFERLAVQKMTRKEFRFHKDFLVDTVRKRAIKRLRCARKDEIGCICEAYRATLPPREWRHFPPTRDIMKAPIFARYIKQDSDRPTSFPNDQAQQSLPKIVAEWHETKREEFALQWMQETGRSSMPIEEAKDRLCLAKSVFLCIQCKELDRRCKLGEVFCGWDAVLSHLCYMPFDRYYGGGYLNDLDDLEGVLMIGHRELEFSARAESLVSRLLEDVGLNPYTTTARQMDDLNFRFFCNKCPEALHRKGVHGKKAYTWKECVSHTLQEHASVDAEEQTTFERLGPEATRFVREHERLMYRPNSRFWGCAHCAVNSDCSVSLPKALIHVKTCHAIATPVCGRDVIQFDNRYSLTSVKQRRPFVYNLQRPPHFKCNLCPERDIGKLYDVVALDSHLREKHNSSGLVEAAHYDVIEVVEPSRPRHGPVLAVGGDSNDLDTPPPYSDAAV